MQHTATRSLPAATKKVPATHCNTLQHTATHLQQKAHQLQQGRCLQYSATHYNTLQHTCNKELISCNKESATTAAAGMSIAF